MIGSDAFDYINILDKAADASYLRETMLANNIANATTPGYKRKDINFQEVLKQELGASKYIPLDKKVRDVHLNHLEAQSYTDDPGYSYRLDGNNVDIATENVELASEQLRYQALTKSVTARFADLKQVLGSK